MQHETLHFQNPARGGTGQIPTHRNDANDLLAGPPPDASNAVFTTARQNRLARVAHPPERSPIAADAGALAGCRRCLALRHRLYAEAVTNLPSQDVDRCVEHAARMVVDRQPLMMSGVFNDRHRRRWLSPTTFGDVRRSLGEREEEVCPNRRAARRWMTTLASHHMKSRSATELEFTRRSKLYNPLFRVVKQHDSE